MNQFLFLENIMNNIDEIIEDKMALNMAMKLCGEKMFDLYNGDCFEIMQQLIDNGVKVDAIITDPPYELTNHGGTKSQMAKRAAKVRDEM